MPDVNSKFAQSWQHIREVTHQKQVQFLDKADFSDFKATWILSQHLPEKSMLHLANSMPVRYAHFLMWPNDLQVYANRGVSGIEGCVSTAVGAARHFNGCTTLLTGDLAMLYDSHALWVEDFPQNLKIIILNNGGGGIFRIIEGPGKYKEKRDYFETPHQLNLEQLAVMYGLTYLSARSESELEDALSNVYGNLQRSMILEIFTNQDTNAEVYHSYFKNLTFNISEP
jgi:2-succinyl-5-enolpyruvyl-6-hydroxy-3-cyclohexene-1-carboxylate synthase